MSILFGDYSSFQGYTKEYFESYKRLGSKSAIVKLTEGTGYLNPVSAKQVANSWKVFGVFGCYHFLRSNDAVSEANFFLRTLKAYGVAKSARVVLDVESPSLPYFTTKLINKFLDKMYSAGYVNLGVYGSSSWFNSNRIKKDKLHHKAQIWVASYGTSQPNVENAHAWQYTDNFHGIDQSHDFGNFVNPNNFKTKATSTAKKPNYWHKGSKFKVKTPNVKVYADTKFKVWTGDTLDKGSIVSAKPVKYGNITRLKRTDAFGYITANTDFMHRIK